MQLCGLLPNMFRFWLQCRLWLRGICHSPQQRQAAELCAVPSLYWIATEALMHADLTAAGGVAAADGHAICHR